MLRFPTSAPPVLSDDALGRDATGAARLRLRLPWIRSLPLTAVTGLTVSVDGRPAPVTEVATPSAVIPAAELTATAHWWFLQDVLEVRTARAIASGPHTVAVSLHLLVPYLPGGPGVPLVLSFAEERTLDVDQPATLAADLRPTRSPGPPPDAADWTFAASAFNWTPEILRAARDATDIVHGIVAGGVADVIEIEPGQTWRGFPAPADAEVAAFAERLRGDGGRVSIVGACLDDWADPATRRDDEARLAFLLPQLRIAHVLGAEGVRLPIGQAGQALLDALLPHLHRLDLTLYEEIQGPQSPTSPPVRAAVETVARLGDPRVRLLVDCSMLMPSLPPSYLDALARAGVDPALLAHLATAWLDEATPDAVAAALRDGAVPPAARTLFMDLLVRFGRSSVADLADLLPLTGAFHLKFWDLDDEGGRISAPLRALGTVLRAQGFRGTLCSEWGGHGWLADADPADMTVRHLALASSALGAPA